MPDWRDYLNPNPEPEGGIPFRAGNVPESTPITVNPSTGGVVPSPDTSGLYAIYGRKNSAQANADRYGRMAGMDMGGRLGQLPGIVATFMAGKKQKEADAIEATKQKDIEDYTKQLSAYNKLKEDKTSVMESAKYLKDYIMPAARDIYAESLRKNGDAQIAHNDAANYVNAENAKMGNTAPFVGSVGFWQGGVVSATLKQKDGTFLPVMIKDGIIADLKGNPVSEENAMLFKDAAKLQELDLKDKAEADRAAAAKQRDTKTANLVTETARLVSLDKYLKNYPNPELDKDNPGVAAKRAERDRLQMALKPDTNIAKDKSKDPANLGI